MRQLVIKVLKGYTMLRGSVRNTGYPLHSPVSPSLPLPASPCGHQVSNALYFLFILLTITTVMCFSQSLLRPVSTVRTRNSHLLQHAWWICFKFTACRSRPVVCERRDIKQTPRNALMILPSRHFIKTARHCSMFQSVKGHLQGEWEVRKCSQTTQLIRKMYIF